MKTILTVTVDNHGGMHVDFTPPSDTTDAKRLHAAASQIPGILASRLGTTEFACHEGCVFAAVIEDAHKFYAKLDPAEYQRLIDTKMLTPPGEAALTSKRGH